MLVTGLRPGDEGQWWGNHRILGMSSRINMLHLRCNYCAVHKTNV